MQPTTALGRWWLPDTPERTPAGTLTFEYGRNGLRLELFGSLMDLSQPDDCPYRRYPIVYGETDKGKLVTLQHAQRVAIPDIWRPGRDPIMNEHLAPRHAFFGDHMPLGGETLARAIVVRFELLEEWAHGDTPFVSFLPEHGTGLTVWNGRYQFPGPTTFVAFGGEPEVLSSLNTQADRTHDHTVTRTAKLVVKYETTISCDEMFDRVVPRFQHFLIFAASAPTQLLDLAFVFDGDVPENRTQVESVHSGWAAPSAAQTYWDEMLLPLAAVRDRFGDVMDRWAQVSETAQSALDLISDISLGPPQYLESRFLSAVQALEVYHRRRFKNSVLRRSEFAAKRTSLLDRVSDDSDLTDWVKQLAQYSNEPRLRQRLEELVKHGEDAAIRSLQQNFVGLATDTRNYLTHYDSASKKKAASGRELVILTEECLALMEACLLRDLGLSSREILDRTGQTSRTRRLLRRDWLV